MWLLVTLYGTPTGRPEVLFLFKLLQVELLFAVVTSQGGGQAAMQRDYDNGWCLDVGTMQLYRRAT
jgi:hypothetical protein